MRDFALDQRDVRVSIKEMAAKIIELQKAA
jgi:hypothetical protein